MSLLLLVRHGQASWGTADYDRLSATGEEQSRVLGRALAARGVTPDLVVRGSMRRHRQTAEQAMAAAGWDVPVQVDAGWDEFDHEQMLRLHPDGVEEGAEMTRAEFQAWFERATRRWTAGEFADEYDESFDAFTDRVDGALRRTAEALGKGGTAVVFTSGGPISRVAATLLGAGAHVWEQLNLVTVNGSVSKVVVGRRGSSLVTLNDHSHLEVGRLVTYR